MDYRSLRDNAYVKAIIHQSESDDVLGYIGNKLPFALMYSFGLYVIPVQSDDRAILDFDDVKGVRCGGARGTALYLKLDKCPLLHSSKLIIVEDFCPVMTKEMLDVKSPKVVLYKDEKSLISLIEKVYGKSYNISEHRRAQKLWNEGETMAKELPWEVGFYSKFLESLEERNEFLRRYYYAGL